MKDQVDWLLLDQNSFFASCEQQEQPELRGKPIAVVAMITDTTSVLAASYEAKKYGIKTGTRVAEARKICPGLQFVETHHWLYLDYHERILKAIEEVIPIHSVLSVDEVSCELTGSQKNLEKALVLARTLKDHVRKQVGECLTSSVGIGPNVLIAKIASDMQKPDGLVWILRDEIPNKLGPLSIRVIPGIGAKMEAHLNQRGIFKIHDLLCLSEAQARALWGSILGSKMLVGIKGGPYLYEHGETKSISHEHVLEPDFRSFPKAYQVALKLLNKACVRMRKSGFRCGRLRLSIKFLEPIHFDRDLKFNKTSDTGFLMKQLKSLWSQIPEAFLHHNSGLERPFSAPLSLRRTPAPFKVSVVLSDFENEDSQQLSFFDPHQGRREKAYEVADLLNKKFGSNTIFTANLIDMKAKAKGGIPFSRIPDKEEFE